MPYKDRYSVVPTARLAKLLSGDNDHREGEGGWRLAKRESSRLVVDQKDAPSQLKDVSKETSMASRSLLSIPSKPDASISPRADLPKLSLVAALDATVAKFWLAAPPPIDRINLR